jgi:hypothetical protein
MKITFSNGILLLALLISGCMELEGGKDGMGSRRKIEEYLTKEIYEVFVESGLRIHTGDVPPWIVGNHEFVLHLVKSNRENDLMGRRLGPFTSYFSDQDYTELSISVYNYDDNGWYEHSNGLMTGKGDNFTIFYSVTYQREEEEYQTMVGLSGKVNEEGKILDFQLLNYMKDNPGISGIIPTGTYRLYEEEAVGEESSVHGQKGVLIDGFSNLDLF